MASLEYKDFRIAFSVAINGNSFNCVIVILAMIVFRSYFSYDSCLKQYHINVDVVVITIASYYS